MAICDTGFLMRFVLAKAICTFTYQTRTLIGEIQCLRNQCLTNNKRRGSPTPLYLTNLVLKLKTQTNAKISTLNRLRN